MSHATFYKWRVKYGGMDTPMVARLKELELENQRFKKMYAEERLKVEIARETIEKVVTPSWRKGMVQGAAQHYNVSVRLACKAFNITRAAMTTSQNTPKKMT